MPAEIIQFRNQPILKITQENSYTKIQIGIKKARLILLNLDVIRDFVAQNPKQEGPDTENKPPEPLREVNISAEV